MRYNRDFIRKGALMLLFVASATLTLKGQQQIDPTVEVTREFDARMLNIHKSALSTTVADSLREFNIDFNYTIFDKPYRDLYEFTPIASAKIYSSSLSESPQFIFKGGVFFPFSPEGHLYFGPKLKRGNFLNFNLGYDGFWGKLPVAEYNIQKDKYVRGEKYSADRTLFTTGADYAKYWNKDLLKIAVGYSRGSNNYFSTASHTYNSIGVKLNASSLKNSNKKFNYSAAVEYRYTDDDFSESASLLKENLIKATVEAGPNFGRYNKFTILLNSENVLYSGLQDYKYGLYELMPQYRFNKGRFTLNAGVKLSGRYKSKNDTDIYHNSLFVNALLSYEIAKKRVWLYGKIDGKNILNNYYSLLMQNRYLSQEADLKATSVPFDIKAGFKGNIADRLFYDIYGGCQVVEGLPQFVYQGDLARLSLIYSKTNILSFNAELGYRSKRVKGLAKFSLYDYDDKNNGSHYGYASSLLEACVEYNYRERIFIEVSVEYRSKAPAYYLDFMTNLIDRKLPAYVSPGVEIKYILNRNFAIFARGNNLLDKVIMHSPYYIEKGCEAGAGIIVKF